MANGTDPLAAGLHRAAIRLLRGLRAADRASGLTAPRLSLLSVLVFGGPASLAELATTEQVSRPTMTRLVQGLEAAGLVRRRPHPEDARSWRIAATPAGRRVLLAGRRRRLRELEAALARLAPEVRAQLAAALPDLEALVAAVEGAAR